MKLFTVPALYYIDKRPKTGFYFMSIFRKHTQRKMNTVSVTANFLLSAQLAPGANPSSLHYHKMNTLSSSTFDLTSNSFPVDRAAGALDHDIRST